VHVQKEDSARTGAIVLLTRLARVVYRESTEELLGISLKQLAALAYLRDHRGTSQQAVSEALCVDANNCVLLLNELESAGLAERHRDPDDRRRHLVTITPAGHEALDRAEEAQQSVEDDVLAALDRSKRETLRQLLHEALEGTVRSSATGLPAAGQCSPPARAKTSSSASSAR
jgi:DNA-binding MarR family transcriptional regulator